VAFPLVFLAMLGVALLVAGVIAAAVTAPILWRRRQYPYDGDDSMMPPDPFR
jgi:hypothetical protein